MFVVNRFVFYLYCFLTAPTFPPLCSQPGGDTWPIVAMSYIYVRKDLTYLSPESAQLLKAFLTAVYTPEYNEICQNTFGFVPVTGPLREKAIQEIANLNTGGGTEWFFEFSTDKTGTGIGQADHTFSVKRNSYSEIEQDSLLSQIAALKAEVAFMKAQGMGGGPSDHSHDHTHDHTHAPVNNGGSMNGGSANGGSTNAGSTNGASGTANDDMDDAELAEFERDEELTVALAMAAVSICLWVFALITILIKYVLHI